MARGRRAKLLDIAAALAGVCYIKQSIFTSGPAHHSALAVAPAAVVAVASAPAFADDIGEASKKLTAAKLSLHEGSRFKLVPLQLKARSFRRGT